MKKVITVLLFMILGMGSMSAQLLGDQYIPHRLDDYDLYYGFRIGYNASTIRFSTDAISNEGLSGMNLGFIAGFPLGNSSAIFEPGIFYTVKGGKLKDKSVKSEVRMHEFEIPIVIKYDLTLPTMTDMSVQPFFGGFFGFGLGGELKYDNMGDRHKLKTFSDRYKRFDAGLRMGCGLNIEFFYVELAYDLGLANLGNDSKAFTDVYPSYSDWDDHARTSNFSINFGVNF